MVSYCISICGHGFYRGYKNRGWGFALPTRSFNIATVLPQCTCAHALVLLLCLAFGDLVYVCDGDGALQPS
jgi:hypothetical protein